MGETPSPAAVRLHRPSWHDTRLVAGVLMVLVAMIGGAAVLRSADASVRVWALRRTLPAGTTLRHDDVAARPVRLFGGDAARYVGATQDPSGRVLLHALAEGELLPVRALGAPATSATRVVGLPLNRAHALGGDVRRGDLVDLIATRKTPGGGYATYAVARRVPVVDVQKSSGGFGAGRNDLVVLVEVTPEQALPVAAALEGAELDLSLVVAGANGQGDVGDRTLVTGGSS
jgi:Flp pilus assembly protein CpaB